MTSPIATNTGGNRFIAEVYNTKSPSEMAAIYDEWAATFDADMDSAAQDYVAPERAVAAVFKALASSSVIKKELEVLDAGCGTGAQGIKFAKHPAASTVKLHIDGLDVSPGMLDVARKTGVYRSLRTTDLSRPIEAEAGKYDVVVCVGTLTHGHVGPEALTEFVRVVSKNGIVVATVLDDIWASGGYKAEVERLSHEKKVDVLGTELEDYRRGAGVRARMLVLRVL